MKFTPISDLHGYLPKDLPGGDVLCICGDIVPLDYQNDFTQSVAWFCMDFAPWADSQPYRKVVFIGGNHDFVLQELGERHRPSAMMKHLLPGAHKGQSKLVYLCDNSFYSVSFRDLEFKIPGITGAEKDKIKHKNAYHFRNI